MNGKNTYLEIIYLTKLMLSKLRNLIENIRSIFDPKENIIISNKFTEKYPEITTRYIIVDKSIGSGTYGSVSLVKDPNTNQLFACKKYKKKNQYTDDYFIKKIHNEFCIASNLKHSNIVRFYDLINYKNDWFAILEYCKYGLYSLCKKGLNIEKSEKYFKQLIDGIEYLHNKGICHRDIKLENLLIDENDNLKVSDFGASQIFKAELELEKKVINGFFGSPPYLAPEIYEQEFYDGEKSDIWSCGVILFIFIVNHMPFSLANESCHLYKYFLETRFNDDNLISRLPLPLKELLLGIMEPDPEKRFGIKDIKMNEWFKNIRPVDISEKENYIENL